jgi:hypothetical protein
MWIVWKSGAAAAEDRSNAFLPHGVLAQGDCSCVVKRDYGDEENVIIG